MTSNTPTIIITGASSGIGVATAIRLAAAGVQLILGARGKLKLDAVTQQIAATGGRVLAVAGDVQDESYARELVDAALATYGKLDGAFNNAGTVGDMKPLPEMEPRNWATVLNTNLTSAFFAAKYQIPALLKSGGGALLFTSSFVGHTAGLPGMSAYGAAKAGLVGLVKGLAAELGPKNIRVNALLPGGTKTPMAGDDPAYLDFAAGLHAMKRLANPDEIASAAEFLLMPASSFVTGTAMLVDGGVSINRT